MPAWADDEYNVSAVGGTVLNRRISDRQTQIIELLAGRSRPLAIPIIAERLGCSERTVQRDVDVLRRAAVDIATVPGRNGGLSLNQPVTSTARQVKTRQLKVAARPISAPVPLSGNEFIGRSNESAQLDQMLDAAMSGQGCVALVLGQPGIGKTRIASELSSRAETLGARAVWGKCRDIEGTPPYWPWIQVMRTLFQKNHFGDETTVDDVNIIASVIPELARLAPKADPTEKVQLSSSQFQLFDSITRLVKSTSDGQPVVIVLDDLQWADQASLNLLEYLAGEIDSTALLIVGTARNIDPTVSGILARSIAELSQTAGFSRLDIEGLTREEMRRLINSGSGNSTISEFADEIFNATEGNPFFAIELSRLYVEKDATRDESDTAPIRTVLPDAVRVVIERRMNGLSSDCVELLAIGAVIGFQFEFEKMRAICELDSDDMLLDLMDDALDARVLSEIDGASLVYEFGHALIHRHLYDSLPAGQRLRIHAKTAEYLERSLADSVELHAPELAHHFLRASSLIGAERGIKYSILAGHAARASYAFDTALEQFSRALAAKEGQRNDSETAEILFGIGLTHNARGGHANNAVDALIKAFDIFTAENESARAIEVALTGIGRAFGEAPQQVGLCERGLAITEPGSFAAARVGIEFGAALASAQEFERSVEVLNETLDIARKHEDLKLEAHALGNLGFTLLSADKLEPAIEAAEHMLRLAYRIDPPEHLRSLGHRTAAMSLLRMGEVGDAKPHIDSLVEIAYANPNKPTADWDTYLPSVIALAEGHWPEALHMAARRKAHYSNLFDFAPEIQVEFMTGDELAAVEELANRLQHEIDASGSDFRAFSVAEFGLMLAVAGRITNDSAAIDLAGDAARFVQEAPDRTPEIDDLAVAILSICAIATGDSEAAAELYGRFENNRGKFTITSATRFIIPSRILALLAAAMGNSEMTTRHFNETIEICDKAGFKVEQAWANFDYATFQIEQGGRIDRTAILNLLNDGIEITVALSMGPLNKRLESLRTTVLASSGRPEYPASLTQREVEVIRLIAAGHSNRDIAEALVITQNTAAKHVANILGKTGSTNRAEAATYANQQGLVSSP